MRADTVVEPIHDRPKPLVLTTAKEISGWLTVPWDFETLPDIVQRYGCELLA